ncbi:MAG: alpha-galactosidase [Marinomonas sp.]
MPSPQFLNLRGGGTFVALEVSEGARPICHYAGVDLPEAEAAELALLSTRQHAPGGPDAPISASLLNAIGTGISGPAGLIAHRGGQHWAIDLRVTAVEHDARSATIHCEDAVHGIGATHRLVIDRGTGVLTCSTSIQNLSDDVVELDWCAALCIPLDPRCDQLMSFSGRWAGEFQIEQTALIRGSFLRENTSGRSSHDAFPGLIAKSAATNETQGPAAAFHFAWSGNHRSRVDTHSDGARMVQMGEMLFPGETCLGSGERYQTPDMLAAWSQHGFGALSRSFHKHLKSSMLNQRTADRPRPIHYNTWEAVYFDHDEAALLDLADKAAEVGAERFVLDDGWFGARRSDKAGLGDWWVSPEVYPNGLHPIASKVKALGMEFGLWFEPEMVNPDSDLYRNHPDWILQAEGVKPISSRGQLPLNLTRKDVREHLFEKITALVSEYQIDYIKWDMNRDIQLPGGDDGRAVSSAQTRAVYALIDQLRAAHPKLEIESCASGGGRADFAVLKRTDRIWTSDNNDARARHSIMRGASHFFPLSVLGNHVGPEKCHITGRRFSMAFRAGTAIFGHMGMELDLRSESAEELAILKEAIALHKRHRALIHGGNFIRLDTAPHINAFGCVAQDQNEALFAYAKLDEEPATHPMRICFSGLSKDKNYRIKLVWPPENPSISAPSIIDAAALHAEGHIFSGAALMGHGIQPPLTFPDTCLIYHLEFAE